MSWEAKVAEGDRNAERIAAYGAQFVQSAPGGLRPDYIHYDEVDHPKGTPGGTWLLDESHVVEPIWGTPKQTLWSKGEPFYIFAPPGIGKSTLVQNLALVRSGVHEGPVLDLPVQVDDGRTLYIAADRSRQVARSWRRMISRQDKEALDAVFVIHTGEPPFTISKQPEELVPWVRSFGDIGTVVVDSLFNLAPSLTDEEGAANANRAFQALVHDGVDVIALHHDRKRGENEREWVSLDDMYGGRPISGGAGSICYLNGEPNSGRFQARWLKAPAGRVEPIDCEIDFNGGRVYARSEISVPSESDASLSI